GGIGFIYARPEKKSAPDREQPALVEWKSELVVAIGNGSGRHRLQIGKHRYGIAPADLRVVGIREGWIQQPPARSIAVVQRMPESLDSPATDAELRVRSYIR